MEFLLDSGGSAGDTAQLAIRIAPTRNPFGPLVRIP
jgi:hypothetical protein